MGIRLESIQVEQDQSNENDITENAASTLQTISGTYSYGGIELRWMLYIVEEKIEFDFYKYSTGASKSYTLDYHNPKAKYEEGKDFRTIVLEVSASFSDKQLILNGKICGRNPHRHGEVHCSHINNTILISW